MANGERRAAGRSATVRLEHDEREALVVRPLGVEDEQVIDGAAAECLARGEQQLLPAAGRIVRARSGLLK
jgi:hypothetical protein